MKTDTYKNLKANYVRCLILRHDLQCFHDELSNEPDYTKKLRLLRNCFTSLNVVKESLNDFSFIIKNNKNLVTKAKRLKKRYEFITHLRNKAYGHLDQLLLEKAAQWEPHIFHAKAKDNDAGLMFAYKSLLESAINSYVDNESNQKVFGTEIDLTYPSNETLFLNYVGDLNLDTIKILNEISKDISRGINFLDDKGVLTAAIDASDTDFKLK